MNILPGTGHIQCQLPGCVKCQKVKQIRAEELWLPYGFEQSWHKSPAPDHSFCRSPLASRHFSGKINFNNAVYNPTKVLDMFGVTVTVEHSETEILSRRSRGPRINGISADAAALGVTREHLQQVLRGKRKSDPLRARYQALKQSQQEENMKKATLKLKPVKLSPQGRAPMPPEFASLQNLQPSFFQTLATLGLEVVIVRFEAGKDSPIWLQKDISTELDAELLAINAGEFDSSFFPLGAQFHFFQIKRRQLGAAMQRLKDAVASRGLLGISSIYHAETAEFLTEWYPGTAAGISIPIEPT